jgi:hypothetical protein
VENINESKVMSSVVMGICKEKKQAGYIPTGGAGTI